LNVVVLLPLTVVVPSKVTVPVPAVNVPAFTQLPAKLMSSPVPLRVPLEIFNAPATVNGLTTSKVSVVFEGAMVRL